MVNRRARVQRASLYAGRAAISDALEHLVARFQRGRTIAVSTADLFRRGTRRHDQRLDPHSRHRQVGYRDGPSLLTACARPWHLHRAPFPCSRGGRSVPSGRVLGFGKHHAFAHARVSGTCRRHQRLSIASTYLRWPTTGARESSWPDPARVLQTARHHSTWVLVAQVFLPLLWGNR